MLESFSESLGLTAQQKEGIGELIALWIFAILIATAIVMIIRHRRKNQPAKKNAPKQSSRRSEWVKKKIVH